MKILAIWAVVVVLIVGTGMVYGHDQEEVGEESFEVWAFDQADTREEGGGLLYIWNSSTFSSNEEVVERIDLAEAAQAAGCSIAKRPHMAAANNMARPSHVIFANVASGDVHFMDVSTREIVGCIRTIGGYDGAGGSVQAHAAIPTPDNSMIIVADIGGNNAEGAPQSGYLHKIATDYAANRYTLVETLPLGQFAEEVGTALVKPICHEYTADGQVAYVTLSGGGLLVINVGSADGSTPMNLAHIYSTETVPGTGCGALRIDDGRMITNGASTAEDGDDFLFVFDTSNATTGEFPDPFEVALPGVDTHGLDVCQDGDGNSYIWTFMRVSSDINVVNLQDYAVAQTYSMGTDFSPNPTPDVSLMIGRKFIVALRGPQPLSGINDLTNESRTPGIAVLDVSDDCLSYEWTSAQLYRSAPDSTIMPSDIHGIEIVPR